MIVRMTETDKFQLAFQRMLNAEGGYVLHKIPGDRGGLTYAGISRRAWPNWPGWEDESKLTADPGKRTGRLVSSFYRVEFWDPIRGDDLPLELAIPLFSAVVNEGLVNPVKRLQAILGLEPDGVVGKLTLDAVYKLDWGEIKVDTGTELLLLFGLSRIRRYANIVKHNPGQRKFLPGWINRVLEEI